MKLFGKFQLDQVIMITVVITLSIVHIIRSSVLGYGFIDVSDDFSPNGTYALLDNLMSLKLWGTFFILNAIFYALGILLFFKKHSMSMLIFSGLMGGLLMFFYVAASWENSTTKIHTHGYIITCSLHFFIALLGGATYWLKTKTKDL